MRILQIGKFYSPALGGIETVVQTLSEGLNQAGVEVTVVCANQEPHFSENTLNGVKILRLPYFGKLFSQPITPTLWRMINRSASVFDIMHFHVPNPLAELSALTIPQKTRWVATYHADVTQQRLLLPFYKPLLNRFLDQSKRIIVPTQAHIDYSPFLTSLRDQSKFDIIPFGLDSTRFKITSHTIELSNQLKLKYGRFLLFVGRLVEYKGVQYLLDAMKLITHQITDLNLVILGDGPLKENLMDDVVQSGLTSRIYFDSNVKDELLLHSHYHACEFFVLPSISRAEAFGMVLLEAMAFGKPLITTRLLTGIQVVNTHEVTGIQVPPRDPQALSKAVIQLAESKELREKMGKASRDKFLAQYTSDAMVTAHVKTYLNIMGGYSK